MFDFAWSEIALIGIVGLIFIGPKDMPTAVRAVTDLIKKGRKLAGEFQTHVDDMVRDADLGEARESFRELRGMNLRGQVMKALDGDGTLRRTLADNPLSSVPAASSRAIPGSPPEMAPGEAIMTGRRVSATEMFRRGGITTDVAPIEPEEPDPSGPAPAVIPPRTARRVRRIQSLAPAPAFLPPSLKRPGTDFL